MLDPTQYVRALEHVEQARTYARLALETQDPEQRIRHERAEDAHRRLAIQELNP